MNLRPDLAFGKFGVGLDIPLRFETDSGNLRKEDWDEAYDILRRIRYFRYSTKNNPDPFYARIGDLDASRLGHGFIMNYYNNSLIYDERKIGLEFEYDFKSGGIEWMTNNLGKAEIFGARGYYRPLRTLTNIPILRQFAVGATYVTDVSLSDTLKRVDSGADDNISIIGFDAELPIIRTSMARLFIYGDVAKIVDHGSGQAAGIRLHLRGIGGLFSIGAQLERRFLGREFLPTYFDPFYERDRDTKRPDQLITQDKNRRGTYGLLFGHLLNTVQLVGSFERIDGVPESGRLHMHGSIPKTVSNFTARASYDDRAVDSFSDVFKLDENSAARLGIGYKINPYLIFFMDYVWTFRFDEETREYKVQKRFEPQLAFQYTFPLGGGR